MKITKKDFIEYMGTAVLVAGGIAAAIVGDPNVKKILFSVLAICMWILTGMQITEYRSQNEKSPGDLIYTGIFAIVALVITGSAVYMLLQF